MLLDIIMNASEYTIATVIPVLIATAMMIFIALPVHEMAHGYTSVLLGGNTPKYSGRLSLNPTKHLDLFGPICLLFCGFGWAKPVGVNPYNYKNYKKGMAITALAGPASNLILSLISMFACASITTFAPIAFMESKLSMALGNISFTGVVYYTFFYFAVINITLAVFNLIPFPPLDGSRILGLILPNNLYYTMMQYEQQLQMILFAVIFLGSGAGFIDKVSTNVFSLMFSGVLKLFSLIG